MKVIRWFRFVVLTLVLCLGAAPAFAECQYWCLEGVDTAYCMSGGGDLSTCQVNASCIGTQEGWQCYFYCHGNQCYWT